MTAPDHTTAFGRLIRAARQEQHLSIRAAALAAHLSEGRWRQLEKGYHLQVGGAKIPAHPSAASAKAIAHALALDLQTVLDAADLQPCPTPPGGDALAVERAVLADPHLTPEAKIALLEHYLRLRQG